MTYREDNPAIPYAQGGPSDERRLAGEFGREEQVAAMVRRAQAEVEGRPDAFVTTRMQLRDTAWARANLPAIIRAGRSGSLRIIDDTGQTGPLASGPLGAGAPTRQYLNNELRQAARAALRKSGAQVSGGE